MKFRISCHVMRRALLVTVGCLLLPGGGCADDAAVAEGPTTQPTSRPDDLLGTPLTADLTEEYNRLKHPPPHTEEERRRMRWLQFQIMRRISVAQGGDLRLKGEVVDEEGERLKDVTAEVTRRKRTPLTEKPPRTEEEAEALSAKYRQREELELKDGLFDISGKDCTGMTVAFVKDGYRKEFVRVRAKATPQKRVDLIKGNLQIDISPVVKDGLRVTLLEIYEKEAKLVNAWGYLSVQPEGPVTALDLFKLSSGASLRTRSRIKEVKVDPGDAEMPPNRMWFSAPVDEKTKWFKTVEREDEYGRKIKVLSQFRFHISGEGAGLILYEPKDRKLAWREMREAPKEGYQSVLEVSPDVAQRNFLFDGSNDRYGAYIFIRTADGRYGKGLLRGGWVSSREPEKVSDIRVRLRIQPDGSRNLKTNR